MASKRIIHMYNTFGIQDYIGEAISILSHSLQAGYLASTHYDGKDYEFIIASLLHDIGHVAGIIVRSISNI